MMGEWVKIDENDIHSYPEEGYDVIVSDDKGNCDVAWYLFSGEYKWVKQDVANDDLIDFTNFKVTKWKHIE
jgi:hypothetical protein